MEKIILKKIKVKFLKKKILGEISREGWDSLFF